MACGPIGNHGFEIVSPNGELETDPDLADQSAAIAQAARELEPIVAAVNGAKLENKRWTLSVHYRLAARDAVPPLRAQVERVAMGLRLRMTDGKEIVEVRPVANIHKGTAVVLLGERLHALRHRTRRSSSWAMIARTRMRSGRCARALRARSRYASMRAAKTRRAAEIRLRDPAAVHDFLEWLAARRA